MGEARRVGSQIPTQFKWVVDWDGTCIYEEWPGMGDWLPHAVEGLKLLHEEDGGVVIQTLRTSPFEPGSTTLRRDAADVAFEVERVRRKLDEAGLESIGIWPNEGKAPGKKYLDDRAVVFDAQRGGWRKVIRSVQR